MGLREAGPFTPFAGRFFPRLARRPPSAPPLAAGWLAPLGAVPGGAPAMSPCTAGDRVRLLCGRCQGGSAPWPASAGVWGRRAAGDGAPAVRRSSAAPAARGRGRKGWVSHLSPSPVR